MQLTKARSAGAVIILFIVAILLLNGCSQSAGSKVTKQLELAVKYLAESKFEEAILAYQEVIKIDPKNVMAYKGLSVAYSLQGKLDKAEQALKDGLAKVEDTKQLKLAMAGVLTDLGQVEKAEALYKELVSQAGTDLVPYQAYTSFLFKQNKVTEAIALLEKAAATNSDYRIKALLARAYLRDGNNEKALASIKSSLTTNPDQSASYALLNDLFQGKWEDLLAIGDDYVQQGQVVAGQILRATALYYLGRYDEVYTAYESLSDDVKASAKLRLLVAQCYAKQGKTDKGIGLLRPINADNLRDAALVAEIARYYLNAGKKDEARRLAMAGIALDGTVVENYIVLWRVAGQDTPEARAWLVRFLLSSCLSPSEMMTFMNQHGTAEDYVKQANAHIDRGEYRDALEDCNKAVDLDPEYYWAYVSRAIAYNFLGEYQSAVNDCTKAIELNSNEPNAYDVRAWAYNELGQYDRAVNDCTKAITLDPSYYYAYDHRAWAYRELGQYDKAVADCNEGIKIKPDYVWFYPNRGWAYLALGQYDKAKTSFQKALEIDPDNRDAKKGLERLANLGH
ncbi:MAG: tetratricopeptide repeat protein [Bacillota bacterium]|nr:tetratricopeptide repeat protein [Bacillota bacterium]